MAHEAAGAAPAYVPYPPPAPEPAWVAGRGRRAPTAPTGREALLAAGAQRLREDGGLLLCGPAGIGKSVLLDALAARAPGRRRHRAALLPRARRRRAAVPRGDRPVRAGAPGRGGRAAAGAAHGAAHGADARARAGRAVRRAGGADGRAGGAAPAGRAGAGAAGRGRPPVAGRTERAGAGVRRPPAGGRRRGGRGDRAGGGGRAARCARTAARRAPWSWPCRRWPTTTWRCCCSPPGWRCRRPRCVRCCTRRPETPGTPSRWAAGRCATASRRSPAASCPCPRTCAPWSSTGSAPCPRRSRTPCWWPRPRPGPRSRCCGPRPGRGTRRRRSTRRSGWGWRPPTRPARCVSAIRCCRPPSTPTPRARPAAARTRCWPPWPANPSRRRGTWRWPGRRRTRPPR